MPKTKGKKSKQPGKSNLKIISVFSRIHVTFQQFVKTRFYMESMGIFLIALSVFITIGFATFGVAEGVQISNCGKLGTVLIASLLHSLGYSSLLLPIVILIKGLVLLRRRLIHRQFFKFAGLLLFFFSISSILNLLFKDQHHWSGFPFSAGGFVGKWLCTPVYEFLGVYGSAILFSTSLLISILIVTDISYHVFLSTVTHLSRSLWQSCIQWLKSAIAAYKDKQESRRKMKAERRAIRQEELRNTVLIQEQPETEMETESFFEETPEESFGEVILEQNTSQSVVFVEPKDETYEPVNIELPSTSLETKQTSSMEFLRTRTTEYTLPTMDILESPVITSEKESRESLLKKSEMLINKLSEFNVQGRVTEVCPGPVITRYEYEPAPGIKISKIIGLSDDLAMGMRSRYGLRIMPMPGKSTLGVEIPNKNRETVFLKDVILSEEFQTAKKKSILTLPLGKDTAGRPFISDLKKMPHLLIAGATGSGKSVCINSILAGLLFIAKPEQLRLLLIDPKMLELSDFNGIPHLREPVITDTKLAPDALNWAVCEMETRYRLLAETGVRNIDQFNKKVNAPDYDGPHEHMPFLVIVIDELADLMITAASSVEESIQRLAQMARAAGIHLIIATQRPSVDVITGVIKANLPCRLAFQVASRIDSRTILDSTGAEKLLGMGDFIFIPPGTSQMVRAHGAYVSESEVKRVVDHCSVQPDIGDEESIFKTIEAARESEEDIEDELYNDAVKLVLTSGLASISMLQRRLKVGHSRASRLIDYMEMSGIVGPHIGSKPREILVDQDEFLNRMNEIEESGIYED